MSLEEVRREVARHAEGPCCSRTFEDLESEMNVLLELHGQGIKGWPKTDKDRLVELMVARDQVIGRRVGGLVTEALLKLQE